MTFHCTNGERDQRRFDIVNHGKPREERETLKHNGDTGNLARQRLTVPQTVPEDGCDKPVSILSKVDLPEPEGPRRAIIFPGVTSMSVGAMT